VPVDAIALVSVALAAVLRGRLTPSRRTAHGQGIGQRNPPAGGEGVLNAQMGACLALFMRKTSLQIGIYTPDGLPESFRVRVDNLVPGFRDAGAKVVNFDSPERAPAAADVIWDPRAGGGNPPPAGLCHQDTPLVCTVHGLAPMALPLRDYFAGTRAQLEGLWSNMRKKREWRRLQDGYAAITTVSEFGKRNVAELLNLPERRLFCCHNAVELDTFGPSADEKGADRYLLHVSNDELRKNVDRILEAYQSMNAESRPRLVLKLPRDSQRVEGRGVKVIRERLTEEQLVKLYQGALGFVFPSRYEGCGLPILEAMACGCPVITSNTTACAEVAGQAALTVDPLDVPALRTAMDQLSATKEVRRSLSAAALVHARRFSWAASARCYMSVFRHVTHPLAK
jgi:glycosyltransferase involved in cell wall biosynthesis